MKTRLRTHFVLKSNNGRQQAGFTIIELLLALSILTSISVFAITMIASQIESRNSLARINEAQHAIDTAMAKIFDDFRHVYIVQKADLPNANLELRSVKPALVWRPSGEEGSFYFSTQNYRSVLANTPQSNLAMVGYFKRKEKDGDRMQLIRRVDTDFKDSIDKPDVGHEDILVTDLKEFKVTFWDGADFDREDWDTNSGDSANKLPKMVKLSLTINMPLTESEEQRRELEGALANRERPTLKLETIVYLLNSAGQADLKEPAKEYKWR